MGCCGSAVYLDYPIDLDDLVATDSEEEELMNSYQEMISSKAPDLIRRFGDYHDANEQIVNAISKATPEAQEAAFQAVVPLVRFQCEIFDFSNTCLDFFKRIMSFFVGREEPTSDLFTKYQHLVKIISEFISIVLKLDEIKLMLPKLLGDVSYFRRSSRRPDYNQYESLSEKSSDLSMFFANSNPFFSKLLQYPKDNASNQELFSKIIILYAGFADMYAAIARKQTNEDNDLLCVKGVTFFIMALDNIHPSGIFGPKSPVHIVEDVRVVVEYQPKQQSLINNLKYTTKHFNDETTLKAVKDLLN
ncbi:protein FAM49B [Histomonas meleagridis]|uniref:protein FAM49B n=1 Tax=Histomonas meleagridis TaxID=135588 RepID=UPI00355A6A23|nr:protein FAM49B [Histomonas meleagridis]KAH0802256.1 protein FAM49B [Histomonas meleagridis]